MVPDIEILEDQATVSQPVFESDEEYLAFRDSFAEQVMPEQEKWIEVRRLSEEEARQRLLH